MRRFDLKTRGITLIGEEKQRIVKDLGKGMKWDGPWSNIITARRRINQFTLKC